MRSEPSSGSAPAASKDFGHLHQQSQLSYMTVFVPGAPFVRSFMHSSLRVITELPIRELSDHTGPVSAERFRDLTPSDIRELLRRGPVRADRRSDRRAEHRQVSDLEHYRNRAADAARLTCALPSSRYSWPFANSIFRHPRREPGPVSSCLPPLWTQTYWTRSLPASALG